MNLILCSMKSSRQTDMRVIHIFVKVCDICLFISLNIHTVLIFQKFKYLLAWAHSEKFLKLSATIKWLGMKKDYHADHSFE